MNKKETERKVLDFIKKYNLIDRTVRENVTVGLSGGADSVCLLLILYNLHICNNLSAVHINHHLRGAESDRDANFSKNLCDKLGLKIDIVDIDVEKEQKILKKSTEETARIMRYKIFEKYGTVATAHSLSDNIETSLYNYMRGSGLAGICGIPPARQNGAGKIIRPILCLTRSDVENYDAMCGENFVTDSTNLTDDYSRNRIRHNLVPLMHEWNSSFENTAGKNFENLRDDLNFLNEYTDKIYKNHVNNDNTKLYNINGEENAIRRRCIAKLLKTNNLEYSYKRIDEIDNLLREHPEKINKINIHENYYIICTNGSISIEKIDSILHREIESPLKFGDNCLFPKKVLRAALIDNENFVKTTDVHKKSTLSILDCDKINGRLIVRNRRYGDKIMPSNRNFHINIKKFLQANVYPEKRDEIYFIEDESGLVYAEKIGVAKRVCTDKKTKKFLMIEIIEKEQE